MKPIGRKVVIRPKEKEEVTSSGIAIVSATTDRYAEGVVYAVGSLVTEVKEKQRILYSPLTYDEVNVEDVIYHVVDEDDVFAIL